MISILCTLAAKLLLEKCGTPSHSKTARHKNCCLWNGSIEPWNLQIGIGWRRTIASKPISKKQSHQERWKFPCYLSSENLFSLARSSYAVHTLFFLLVFMRYGLYYLVPSLPCASSRSSSNSTTQGTVVSPGCKITRKWHDFLVAQFGRFLAFPSGIFGDGLERD